MNEKKIKRHLNILILIATVITLFGCGEENHKQKTDDAGESVSNKEFKVVHVMSYHESWPWTDEQYRGFKDALNNLDIEYRTIEMNTKRKSSIEWKEEIGKEAREFIDKWQPDLLFTTDDNAQEYVAKYYVNSEMPVIFSGVNSDPAVYGYSGSKNARGVIEREYIVETVALLKEMVPGVKRIIVILDVDITWVDIAKRIQELVPKKFPDVRIVVLDPILTFEDYKRTIRQYQTDEDAFALLGIYAFKDEQGKEVPFDIVSRWTVENSKRPDFSFWDDRVYYGTFCSVYLSGYQQGLAAGDLAKKILSGKASPSDFPMTSNVKGSPIISLARANRLGIKINSSILLSAQIVPDFKWD